MAKSSKLGLADIKSERSDPLTENEPKSDTEEAFAELTRVEDITNKIAKILIRNGIKDIKAIGDMEEEELSEMIGGNTKKASDIKKETAHMLKGNENESENSSSNHDEEGIGDDALSKWLTGDTQEDLGGLLEDEIEKAKKKDIKKKDDDDDTDHDALKSWLTGEDDSFDDWLGEETFEDEKEEFKEEMAEKEELLEESKKKLDTQLAEISLLKQEFQKRLEEVDSNEFDPQPIIEENVDLRGQVARLEENIAQLEQEKQELINDVMEIKQGSVAMLKYLKTQKTQDAPIVESEDVERLKRENEELKERIKVMESSGDYKGMDDDDVSKSLAKNEALLERKEKEIEKKDERIEDLLHELEFKKKELKNIKDKMEFKDEELSKREEDLIHREEVMKKQMMEMESLKEEFGGTTEKERKRHLEDLEKEISRKEQEIRAKEKYIEQKQRELRSREEELIDEELEERQEEILMEIKQEKAKTGTSRLDDLTMGGIPLGSNVSIYGPPHSGKRVLINSFIAEGIEKGVPAIWVVTDKTVGDIREEMKFVLPTYKEYEMRGLIYYVDAYSIGMGEDIDEGNQVDNITYIDGQSNIEAITKAVEKYSKEIMENHRYYRLAFVSISTLIAYLDTSTTFRALQPFAGRRKRDRAVSMYTLEKGMHSEQDISMLGHMMDGEIEFKFQQLNTFLKVGGLGDVQTRDWVKYTFSKSGITMGSFSLDTIR
ncbi:MAG: ATPase domain-containing protein [Thermoplasmata archaeon]